jgi:8-oxo-dGTP pyrophosphatase MutT (NUDIX family)
MDATSNVIHAAGGIVRRATPEGVRIVLVHRPMYRDWALPKGKVNRGEAPESAAIREVMEEAACRAAIVRELGTTEYLFRGRRKSVTFWLMDLVEELPFTPNPEIDAISWQTPEEALRLMDYAQERELVKQAFPST